MIKKEYNLYSFFFNPLCLHGEQVISFSAAPFLQVFNWYWLYYKKRFENMSKNLISLGKYSNSYLYIKCTLAS